MRTILQDVDRVLASGPYKLWASTHRIDDGKVRFERAGNRRPQSGDSYARCLIVAIRAGLVEANPAPPPSVPTPEPPPASRLAPQTYNRGSSGQDARYSVRENCAHVGPNRWQDQGGYQYDDSGLCLGGRSGSPVLGLKPADEMDGREPWMPYTNGSLSFPPWPAASYEV
jgi:hypothetical protein